MQIPAIIHRVLQQFGIVEEHDIQAHLSPKLKDLPNPWGMRGIRKAADLIAKAITDEDEIVIWGDYDVDGTCGTALLVNFFRDLGTEPLWHIPNRLNEGYGINSDSFARLHEENINGNRFLFITVDCGISNYLEIEKIKNMGGEVIVTDHHQLPNHDLPNCTIVNPSQENCGFHESKLAGVGVAFYLIVAVRSVLESQGFFNSGTKPNLKEFLGFVALGTIADLVEMTAINRILVRGGMEVLQRPAIPGLNALIQGADLLGSDFTTEDISFTIAPRINAAGRLGKAEIAVELMTCDNVEEGSRLSRKLEKLNNTRKAICEETLESALNKLDSSNVENSTSIVVSGDFHFGVIGIVASKLIDRFGKPSIVFSHEYSEEGESILKGSGRSIAGVDLLECLHESSDILQRYGGHAMAAGMSLSAKDLDKFTRNFDNSVGRQLLAQKIVPSAQFTIDCEIDEVMEKNALEYLLRLEPFGPEIQRPTFVDNNANVIQSKKIGNAGQHLQLVVRGKYENYRAVGFGLGERMKEISQSPNRKIVFTPMINRFRGRVEWQLRILDI